MSNGIQLYNNLSAEEQTELIDQAGVKRLTLSFYKYHNITNPDIFRDHVYEQWHNLNILGRIFIAHEGINAQLSIAAPKLDTFKKTLDDITFLKGIRLNIAIEQNNKSFLKLKIKVRSKILADGLDDKTFDPTDVGVHLKAQEFNNMIDDPNTILVDMRNHYETEIGHFENAMTPDVDTFRDSLEQIEKDIESHKTNKNIVMYCTGGIRCEKASAYFKHKGFKKLFQLEGGIIEYARQVKKHNLENKFRGKNFVFDQRMAERISEDIISACHQCGQSSDTHVNCANEACHLLFIQCDICRETMEQCCSNECKKINSKPLEEQKKLRRGKRIEHKIFKKGRFKKN
tara:strand:- start:1084 stop:2115 length:1032 start_codon:yes stop_codon:yes gene_type:complete